VTERRRLIGRLRLHTLREEREEPLLRASCSVDGGLIRAPVGRMISVIYNIELIVGCLRAAVFCFFFH